MTDALPQPRRRWHAWAIVPILLLAVWARWHALDRESLWFDEGWTWWLTTLPTSGLMRVIRGDVVAPAYFYLLHAWTAGLGDGAIALRALSALLSTLAFVPFAFAVRRATAHVATAKLAAMFERRPTLAAVAAIAFFGVASIQVQFARDARPYTLLLITTLGALACAMAAAERRSWRAIAGFVACVVVGLYTHNMMAFTVVGLSGAWLAWPGDRTVRGRACDLTIAGLCVAICYAPWLPILLEQTRWIAGKFWLARPTWESLAFDLSEIVGVVAWNVPPLIWDWAGMPARADMIAKLTCVTAALGTTLAITTRDARQRRVALALASVAFGPPALVLAYGLATQPLFVPRLFIASNAALMILLALPLAVGRSRGVRIVGAGVAILLLLLMAMSTYALLSTPQKEDWRGAYERVARLPPSERRLIVFVATEGELPFAFYASHDRFRTPEPRTGVPGGFFDLDPPRTIRRVLHDEDLTSLRTQLASGRWEEIVLVLGHDRFADPDGRTEAELRTRWRLIDEWSSRHVRVLRFAS